MFGDFLLSLNLKILVMCLLLINYDYFTVINRSSFHFSTYSQLFNGIYYLIRICLLLKNILPTLEVLDHPLYLNLQIVIKT